MTFSKQDSHSSIHLMYVCVCVCGPRGHRLDCVTLCHPYVWKQSALPLAPRLRRERVETQQEAAGGRRGLLRAGSDHGSAAGRPQKAKHSCIWIIYCTNSHICISGHFQVTGAQWFTSLCQNVLVLVWNRMDIKLVWIQVPSWIFKAAV